MIYARNDLRYIRWVNEEIWQQYECYNDQMKALYKRRCRKGEAPGPFQKVLGAPAILGGWLNEPDGWCKT
tara:strand:- start:546 stop:755 length:210 start_codon:yes stop_codon:yes gene_type:complete